jgi:RNA polymerase sigma-70 factor (ECF subfamily)
MSMTDVQTLVRRAQDHDSQAFTELYEMYARQVYSYLYFRLNRHAHEAEDLTADVFLMVYERIGSYQEQGVPFTAWLFRLAHNLLIDHIRSRPRYPQVGLEAAVAVAEPSTARELERRLTVDQLRGALVKLTDEQQQVVILRFVQGLSVAETALAVGKTDEAVKKLQARGLMALRRALDGQR